MKKINIVGKRFGLLTVVEEAGKNKHNKLLYTCSCDCGNTTTVAGTMLRSGRTQSCGCLQRKRARAAKQKHKYAGTRTYRAWLTMRTKSKIGIYIEPSWDDVNKFVEDIGESPSSAHRLCRRNLKEGFTKDNTYWDTAWHIKTHDDVIGKRFGMLEVIDSDGVNVAGTPVFKCKCDCGGIARVTKASLKRGETKSCGCSTGKFTSESLVRSAEEFIHLAREKHGTKYDYSLVTYLHGRTKVKIICPIHGAFEQEPTGHLQGYGCRKCADELNAKNNTLTQAEFLQKAKAIHGDKYDYSKTAYTKMVDKITAVCPEHGEFKQKAGAHIHLANGCPTCGKKISSQEKEVADFVESLGFSIKRNIRTLFAGSRKEADIFIPAKNLIIEYDGNVWHSKRFATDPFNVLNKTRLAEENGYECMHIRSDQWNKQKDLVKSLIKSRLGMFEHRIGARQTVKRSIGEASYKKLADENHLQGYRPAKYRKGLFYKDILVACISYDDAGELIRYVVKNGWQIQGALPKLIKGENITYSFCDLTFFSGKSYPKAGFKLDYITKPNYRYVNGTYTVSRNSMMKHKLEKQLDTFDPALTEEENCANNGWYKLYDCGNAKFVLA